MSFFDQTRTALENFRRVSVSYFRLCAMSLSSLAILAFGNSLEASSSIFCVPEPNGFSSPPHLWHFPVYSYTLPQ